MPPGEIKDDEKCPVCLFEIDIDKNLYTTRCGHKYHRECLKPWFKKNDSCPSCRECLITPRNRAISIKCVYIKPVKKMDNIKFLFYLIDGSSYDEVDYDIMLNNALNNQRFSIFSYVRDFFLTISCLEKIF